MSILNKITHHHNDEKKAVEDALPAQKLRVSLERRIHNAQLLINEEVAESHKKHNALAKLHDFRIACEAMLNEDVTDSETEQ